MQKGHRTKQKGKDKVKRPFNDSEKRIFSRLKPFAASRTSEVVSHLGDWACEASHSGTQESYLAIFSETITRLDGASAARMSRGGDDCMEDAIR